MTDKPKPRTRRDEILDYIAEYAVVHHNAPSTYEIATAFGLSQTRVYGILLKLKQEGRLSQPDGRWKVEGAEYIPPDPV